MDLEEKLEALADLNCYYDQLYINKIHGSIGLHGLSMYKKNYSSTMYHLNYVHTKMKFF